jgi:hypothetical protein
MDLTVNHESPRLWPNALVILGLLAAHILINHRFVFLRAPVGTDPCDAVNAFAFYTIAFIAIGSALRMLGGRHSSPPLRYLFTVRSQQAVLFAIFITFAAEIIALLRNPERWIGNRFAELLFALVVALTVVTLATLVLILVTQRNRISLSALHVGGAATVRVWTRTILPVAIAIVVLAICPEWPIDSPSRTAHILTVALGALVVFIPMRLFLSEIVLRGSDGSDIHRKTTTLGTARDTAREWTLLLVGVAVVLFGFFRHIPILVFDIGHLVIAYALMGALLGFAGNQENSTRNAHADK